MTVQCITCQNFDLQGAGRDKAVQGFGECAKDRPYALKSATYHRECEKFVAAGEGVAEKREAWINEQWN